MLRQENNLTLCTLSKIFSKQCIEIFFLFFFSPENMFLHFMPMETICMESQILFSGKHKKTMNLSPAELAQRVVKINPLYTE